MIFLIFAIYVTNFTRCNLFHKNGGWSIFARFRHAPNYLIDPSSCRDFHVFSSSNDFQSQIQKLLINGKEYRINCSIIAPYIEVLQHAGYTREGLTAVMVFQARKLPTKDVRKTSKKLNFLKNFCFCLRWRIMRKSCIIYFYIFCSNYRIWLQIRTF